MENNREQIARIEKTNKKNDCREPGISVLNRQRNRTTFSQKSLALLLRNLNICLIKASMGLIVKLHLSAKKKAETMGVKTFLMKPMLKY